MIKKIKLELVERNLEFKRKLMENVENIEIGKDFPTYPVLFLTCMDPKIDIHRIFQFNVGDVFILRNAGNLYSLDMLRSILIAIVEYNIKFIIVMGHLNCGMAKVNLTELRQKLPSQFLSNLTKNYSELLPKLRNFFKPIIDELQNIKKQIKSLELVKEFYPEIEITGMLYEVNTGLVYQFDEFKDYKDIKSLKKNYKDILTYKKNQFRDFLEKMEIKESTVDDINDLSHEKELNIDRLSTISESKEEPQNNAILGELDSNNYEKDIIRTIIPKIKVPKIQFHGVKIYLPKRYNKKREFAY